MVLRWLLCSDNLWKFLSRLDGFLLFGDWNSLLPCMRVETLPRPTSEIGRNQLVGPQKGWQFVLAGLVCVVSS